MKTYQLMVIVNTVIAFIMMVWAVPKNPTVLILVAFHVFSAIWFLRLANQERV